MKNASNKALVSLNYDVVVVKSEFERLSGVDVWVVNPSRFSPK